ncbi:MAG: rhomboid family intramembrane serine protease [Chitinophagaceae bacterium]
MAFGLTPRYSQEQKIENRSDEQLQVLAIEAALKLDWNIAYTERNQLIAHTRFSFSSWSEEVTVNIADGVLDIKSECTGNQIIDWGKNRKNVERFIATVQDLSEVLTPEEMEQKGAILQARHQPEQEIGSTEESSVEQEKSKGFLSLLKPTTGFFIAPILIGINVLIFIIMAISGVHVFEPENQDLLNWGANFRPLTLDGEWWRLFTSCFLHIGVIHLLFNMYALLYIGTLLEPMLGRTRFLAAYLISGVAASVTSLWWHELTISAGASGAIFGLYGVFIALLTRDIIEKSERKALITSMGVFVGYNLLYGLRPGSGVDNAAHIGGLLSGLVIGFAFVPGLRKFENRALKLYAIGALTGILFIGSFFVFKMLPNDLVKYDQKMEKFVLMESLAMEVYNLPEETPKEKILESLKEKGIYYWKENLKLLDSVQQMDLPAYIEARNTKLKEYCELRIKAFELIYASVNEESDQYNEAISNYNNRIEAIIEALSGNRSEAK